MKSYPEMDKEIIKLLDMEGMPLSVYAARYIEKLQAEVTELRERLDKAIELPVKVGDTVWFFDSDRILKEGKISMLQCKSDGNWKMRITYNLVSYKTVFDDYCNKLGIKYFTDRAEAEAKLKALQGRRTE